MQRTALLLVLIMSLSVLGIAQQAGSTGTTTSGTPPSATPGPTASPTPVTSQPATQAGAPTTVPNQPNTAPPATAPSQVGVPVGPGLIQQGGFVQQTVGGTTVLAPTGSMPLVKTPIITLDAPAADPVGASNATGNMTAGASNATLAQPNVSTGGMVVDQSEANVPAGFNLGPGVGAGVGSSIEVASGSTVSLADAAQRQRNRGGQTTARIYTNEDIERLNQAPGFRSGEQIEREEALASAAEPGQAEGESEGLMPEAPQSEGQPIAQQGAGQTAGAAMPEGGVTTQPRNARGGAGTTPQEPAAPARSEEDAAGEELPASGSPLPLLALLGLLLASSGIVSELRRH